MPFITLVIYLSSAKDVRKQHLFILVYLVFNFVLFGITDVLALNSIHNMPFYHLFSVLDVWFLSYYLLEKITGKKFSLAFILTGCVFTLFCIIDISFWEDITVFNSNSAGVANLIILFLCMSYLLKLSKSDEILYFQRLPAFWIVSGLLIYNALSILVVLSYKYFVYFQMHAQSATMWYVLSAGNIVKFALISIGLLCHRKRPATHSPFLL